VLEGAPRLVRGVTGHMDLSIRADETAGLIDEDRRVVSVRGAGLVGELSVPEAEAKPRRRASSNNGCVSGPGISRSKNASISA